MADFLTSTHRERWIFTQQHLMQKREAANQRAVKMLEQYGATRLEVDVDGSLSYPEPLHDLKDKAERHSLKPLNCEEEQFMRVFYEQKIQEVCGAFRFPHKIQATAIIYFKRFYLQWSVMEHQPKHIMLTCIYSSCKVEENHVSAEELGKGIQQDHQIILNNEMIVLQSLGFDLIVYAPYRSIEGFIEDMEEFCQARDEEQEKLKELREAAKSEVDRMMLTDAPLLFTPGQLALAALHRSNEVLRVLDFERYLESLLSRQGAHTISELAQSMTAIDILNMFSGYEELAQEEAELLARFKATLTDPQPLLSSHCMDYMEYSNGSEADTNDTEDEPLIHALLDANISADEIDRRFSKNACRNALDLV